MDGEHDVEVYDKDGKFIPAQSGYKTAYEIAKQFGDPEAFAAIKLPEVSPEEKARINSAFSALPEDQIKNAGAVHVAISQDPKAFRYAKNASGDLQELAKAFSTPENRISVRKIPFEELEGYRKPGTYQAFEVSIEKDGKPMGTGIIYETRDDTLYIDSSKAGSNKLKAGGGDQLYQLALTYAKQNGMTRVTDPAGLSDVAATRVTSQMLSSALRSEGSDHFTADPLQRLVKPLTGDLEHDAGILALTELRNIAEVYPAILSYTFDPASGKIRNDKKEFGPRGDDFGNLVSTIRAREGGERFGATSILRGIETLGSVEGLQPERGNLDRADNESELSRITPDNLPPADVNKKLYYQPEEVDPTYLDQALKRGKNKFAAFTRPVRQDEQLPLLSQRRPIKKQRGFNKFDFKEPARVKLYDHEGNSVTFQFDPNLIARPVFKDAAIEHAGKPVQLAMADRHTAAGGDMGGILFTYLLSNHDVIIKGEDGKDYRVVWANNEWKPAKGMKNKAQKFGAYDVLVYLMNADAHASNARTVRSVSNELDFSSASPEQKALMLILAESGVKQQKRADANKLITKHQKAIDELEEQRAAASDNDQLLIDQQQKGIIRLRDLAQNRADLYIPSRSLEQLSALVTAYKVATTNAPKRKTTTALDNATTALNEFMKTADFQQLRDYVDGKHLIGLDNTFKGRKAAVHKLRGLVFGDFNVNELLKQTADFEAGRTNHLVASVELSRNPDLMAVYLGNDPRQAKFMTPQEAKVAAQLKADPRFVIHEAYKWVMIGPKDGNNFLNTNPKTHEEYFPEFRQTYAASRKDAKKRRAILNGNETTIMGAMRDSAAAPLVMKKLISDIPASSTEVTTAIK
jgi:hypothetical protein